ncbi:SRPBCC domain-containing protein [Phyllobacterium sp. K27]
MSHATIRHATLNIERRIAASIKKVFAAWSRKDAVLDWSAPGDGWEMSNSDFDFRAGHRDICTFGPIGATPYVNTVHYEEIKQDNRILYSATISHDGILIFVGVVAVTFKATGYDTLLQLTETGFYLGDADTPEGHEAGWSAMLENLANYVELPASGQSERA